jgi:hypothetical protein
MQTEESPKFSGSHSRQKSASILHAILAQATTPRWPVSLYGDSVMSSLSTHLQLCSAGFAVGVCVTAFPSRFTD